jgi:formate dehydrogenase iron-sulfur subunit
MAKAILYDASKCTACRACQVACKGWNELPAEKTTNRGTLENPPDLSPQTWLKMEFREYVKDNDIKWYFTRRACMHCTDAGCVTVCPTGALYKNEDGFISYDKSLCSGCGYCEEACPFSVPRSTRNVLTGAALMDKCTACTSVGLNRIEAGNEPACVNTCPTGALTFGDREALVADGRQRVAALQASGFGNAYFYGDTELGGLHVLYVLPDTAEAFGLPPDPKVSGLVSAWQDVIQPLGWGLGGAAIVGLGLNYIVARANANKEN